jgi:hypothetical protein
MRGVNCSMAATSRPANAASTSCAARSSGACSPSGNCPVVKRFALSSVHRVDRHPQRVVAGEGRDGPVAGVGEVVEAAADRVRESALDADLLDQPRREAAAEHGVGDQHRVMVGMAARQARRQQPDLALRHLRLADDADTARGCCLGAHRGCGTRSARPAGERELEIGDDALRIDVADHGEDRVLRRDPATVMRDHVVARDRLDRGLPAGGRVGERSLSPQERRRFGVDRLGWIVLARGQGAERFVLLAGELRGGERRSHHHVAQQLEAEGAVLGQHLAAHHQLLGARERLQLAADRLDRLGDLLRGAGAGALGQQLRREVGKPLAALGVVGRAGAGAEPVVDERQPPGRHHVDGEAVPERGARHRRQVEPGGRCRRRGRERQRRECRHGTRGGERSEHGAYLRAEGPECRRHGVPAAASDPRCGTRVTTVRRSGSNVCFATRLTSAAVTARQRFSTSNMRRWSP